MDISVAIATRNRPEPLARCLAAIAAADRRPAEVVVVDQSDGDETSALLAAHRQLPFPLVGIRQAPLGLGAAQNAAVSAASGTVVAITDDDCLPDASWLSVIAGAFGEHPAPDVVTGRVLPLEPQGDRIHPVATRSAAVRREFRGRSVPWHVGSGNNFAVRREWYLRVGGCDERLGPGSPAQGGVDLDLFYRLLRAGAWIRYEPAALVRHERQTARERRDRRPMYGRGMGAAVAFRLRERDLYALRLLAGWVALRAARLVRAGATGQWSAAGEELLMLRGTAGGLVHGLRAGGAPERRG